MNPTRETENFLYENRIGKDLRVDGFRVLNETLVRRECARWTHELEFFGTKRGPMHITFRLTAVGAHQLSYCIAVGLMPKDLRAKYISRIRPLVTSIGDLFESASPEEMPLEGKWRDTPFDALDAILFAAELRWAQHRFAEAAAFCARGLAARPSLNSPRLPRILAEVEAEVPYAERTWGRKPWS